MFDPEALGREILNESDIVHADVSMYMKNEDGEVTKVTYTFNFFRESEEKDFQYSVTSKPLAMNLK